ncbi:MAG: hypothetical protein ABIL49_06615 [candidate division WOR-3 bacterium]|jgi:hypothetical protein
MLFIFITQFMVLDGGKLEEDNQICKDEFRKFSGAFPEEVFSSGFTFDVISHFKIEKLEKIQKSIFTKAIESKFFRIIKSDDIEIYIDPESRMKFQVDSLTLNFFTRYLVVKYLKDRLCIYSFRPSKGEKQ